MDAQQHPSWRRDPSSAQLRFTSGLRGPDRLSLVSSLYGPGTFIAWLCTVISVVVTWTFHPDHAHHDTITNDLVVAVAMPAIATAHFLYQLYHLTRSGSTALDVPLLASSDLEDMRIVAALEAPLAVCDAFVWLALVLFSLAARRGQQRRAVLVLTAGLVAFSLELVLFVQFPGIPASAANLARPFIFQFGLPLAMATWWLSVLTAFFFAELGTTWWLVGVVAMVLVRWFGGSSSGARWAESRSGRARSLSGLMAAVSIPLWAVFFGLLKFGSFGNTPYYGLYLLSASPTPNIRLLPKTLALLTDLDQAVALGFGVTALCFSVYDALKARRAARERAARQRSLRELWPMERDAVAIRLDHRGRGIQLSTH